LLTPVLFCQEPPCGKPVDNLCKSRLFLVEKLANYSLPPFQNDTAAYRVRRFKMIRP